MEKNTNLIVSREQMQEIDSFAINELNIPAICLVERAAMAVLKNIDTKTRHTFAVFVGVGNNGADAMALARNLLAQEKYVDIYILGNLEKASPEFLANFNSVKTMTDQIYQISTISDMEFLEENLNKVNTIIDGIFGTGLNKTIEGAFLFVIDLINRKRIYTISIDIPSGLDASTGESLGDIVDSDLIVSMQCMKQGVFNKSYFREKTIVEDIGIAKRAIDEIMAK